MTRYTLSFERTALWNGIIQLQKILLVATGAFSALLVTINVICRYVIKVDVFAIDEIIKLVTMWMYFVGAGYCSQCENHIVADLLSPMLKSGKAKKTLKLITEIITVTVQCFFVVWGFQYVVWCIERGGRTPGLKIPMIASQITTFVGIFMMLVYTAVRMIGYIKTPAADFLPTEAADGSEKETRGEENK